MVLEVAFLGGLSVYAGYKRLTVNIIDLRPIRAGERICGDVRIQCNVAIDAKMLTLLHKKTTPNTNLTQKRVIDPR